MKNDNSSSQQTIDDEDFDIHNEIPEAVMRHLAKTVERVDLMCIKEVINKLKKFHVDTEGSESLLKDKLKESYKKIYLAGMNLSLSKKLLPYYVIIDFEATCEENHSSDYMHEIIEFPAVLVNSRKQQIVDCFQMYCKPQINPIISEFCTELTGITQEQVDSAETFDKVMDHFKKWLKKNYLGVKYKFAIVTDSPWDMSKFLYSQCHYSDIPFPSWASKWINLRKSFSKFYKQNHTCLKHMLQYLEMPFVGRPHCGLDDAKNIARILLKMIYDGANIQINERLTEIKDNKEKIKIKSSCEQMSRTVEEKESSDNDKIQKFRVEAHFKPIYNVVDMPIYKNTKRERLIAETKLARKILRDNVGEKSTLEEKLKNK